MRTTATATLGFGLVSIPVKVYLATADGSLKLRQINPETGNTVSYRTVDAVTGAELDRAHLARGYEWARKQYVVFAPEELKRLAPESTKRIEIRRFAPSAQLSATDVAKTYYLGCDKGGDRAYALLREAMAAKDACAVAQWTNREREHLVVLLPHGRCLRLHQLYYQTEVRPSAEVEGLLPAVTLADDEREMAERLIDSKWDDELGLADYRDTYAERLLAAAEQKAGGGELTLPQDGPAPATVIDLMAALKASLAKAGAPKPKARKRGKRAVAS